jgi:glycosyltransferase involved in cell wall biosynthesis
MTPGDPAGRTLEAPRPVTRFGFVPSNSSQVGKFRPLMDALRSRGDEVVLLDVDTAYGAAFAARAQIEASGYPSEALAPVPLDPDAHWLRQALRRSAIERAFDDLLVRSAVDVLVFGYDSFAVARAFVRVGKQHDLPTVLIPDGLVVPPNPRYRRNPFAALRDGVVETLLRALGAGSGRGRSGVDAVLVMNSMGREALVAGGVPPETIHVVGSPEYEALAARVRSVDDAGEAEAVRARLGLDRRPVILFAHQDLHGNERGVVRTLVEAGRRAGAVVLVKLHPRASARAADWILWAEREGIGQADAVFVGAQCTSIEAVRVAALCVTAYSTVCLEAFVCGRPVVILQYANVPYALPYAARYGAVVDAGSPAELIREIIAVLRDPGVRARLEAGRPRAIAGELGGLDGGSVERMLQAIDALRARRPLS